MDHISIIIVHYNTDKDTRDCLASLQQVKTTRDFKFDTIILDNASKIPFHLKPSEKQPNIELIRSDSNLGFTGGNNLAVQHAIKKHNSDYVLLLNSDTLVDPDFLKNLYKCTKNHPKAGLINPKIYFAKHNEFHKTYSPQQKGKVFWYGGGSIDWQHLTAFHQGVDEVDRGQFDQVKETDFATGCCLWIPREIIESVGLLDDDLFLYSEDVDYSLRVKKAGYQILFCPDSIIWHKNAGSSGGSGSSTQVYYQTRNSLFIAKEYGDWRAKVIAIKLIFRILLGGSPVQKEAVRDLLIGNMGKKAVIESTGT